MYMLIAYSLIFEAECDGTKFILPLNDLQWAGGKVEVEQGAVHHVGGGVV